MTFPEDGARFGEVYQNVHETRLRGQVREHVRQRLIFGSRQQNCSFVVTFHLLCGFGTAVRATDF